MEVIERPMVTSAAGVAVACLPWCPVDRLVAAKGGGERADINREASWHLISIAQELRRERAEKFPDLPAILLGHWSVEGGVTATGVEAITFAEPILPLADLEALGFAAVFMGHVHKPQVLNDSSDRLLAGPVIIPGSPLPLNFGEEGTHGVWIFDTETGAAEFVPIESRAFVSLDFDANLPNQGAWLENQSGAFPAQIVTDAIVKVKYQATAEQARRIDHRKLRDALYAAGAFKVYAIEAVVERETRARDRSLDTSLSELEALDRWMVADEQPPAMQARMRETLAEWIEEGVA
jgi:exonuclease SbcD